jgi:ribose transport system substrate-binding protein
MQSKRTANGLVCFLSVFVAAGLGDSLVGGCKPAGAPTTSPTPSKPGRAGAGQRGGASPKIIGLSVLTLTNPFFKEIADHLTGEARQHGYEVITASGEFDVARQQNQVKDFIVKQVAAVVLTPCDSKSIGPAIAEAKAAGLPVFTADIACLAPGAKVVCHVATDNYGGGQEAARAMIEALGEAGGKIAVLDFKEVESCILRVRGFKEVLAGHNADRSSGRIDLVAELPGGGVKCWGWRA